MTAQTRALFAETMSSDVPELDLACALIAAEVQPDLDPAETLAALDRLAEQAIVDVAASAPAFDVASGLRSALGDRAGFRGYGTDYGDLRASLLPDVLARRRGLPILLSVVYVEVGRRLGARVVGVGVPGHFVAAVIGEEGRVLLDPFYGGRLITPADLSSRVSEILGEPLEMTEDLLQPWPPQDVVTRILGNIRAASTTSGTLRTRLWAVELSMLVPGAPASLRKERGEVLARLGDFVGAARSLESYAEAVAPVDPDAAEEATRNARLVRSRLS